MHVIPDTTKESISAGPVRSCAATPVRTKMPCADDRSHSQARELDRTEHTAQAIFAVNLFQQRFVRLGQEQLIWHSHLCISKDSDS